MFLRRGNYNEKKILLFLIVFISIFSVTGCRNNSTNDNSNKVLTETYKWKDFSITMKAIVSDNGKYELTKNKPSYEKSYSGSIFLNGEKIIISCSPISYMMDSMVNTYDEMKDKMFADSKNQEYHIEEVKFAGRKAIKMDLIDKKNNNQLYGYSYKVQIDDIDSTSYVFIRVMNKDLDNTTIDELYNDTEIKSVIDSIEFTK